MEEKKLTYEELQSACMSLQEQNKSLYKALMESNMQNLFARLDYLFKVLENSKMFPEEFISSCVAEIQEKLTLPKEEEK